MKLKAGGTDSRYSTIVISTPNETWSNVTVTNSSAPYLNKVIATDLLWFMRIGHLEKEQANGMDMLE